MSDFEEIVEFVDKHLHNPYHDPGFISSGLIRDRIRRATVWMVGSNHLILGIAIGRPNGGLWNLVVHKHFRKQGIGSTLVRAVNPRYVRIKCKGGLPDPTLFYVKNGFTPVGFVDSDITKKRTILLAIHNTERSRTILTAFLGAVLSAFLPVISTKIMLDLLNSKRAWESVLLTLRSIKQVSCWAGNDYRYFILRLPRVFQNVLVASRALVRVMRI